MEANTPPSTPVCLAAGMPRHIRSHKRAQLLAWASRVSGLPLVHISELQNGAVFLYLLSLVYSDLDLSLVNYDAQEECECMANFRLLQAAARAERVPGLSPNAKLSHYGRLATSESDAWAFLELLKRCLEDAGKADAEVEIAADSTAPPPPAMSRKSRRRRLRLETGLPQDAGSDSRSSSLGSASESGRSRSPASSSLSSGSPRDGVSLVSSQGSAGRMLACLPSEELAELIQEAHWQPEQTVRAGA